MDTPRQHLLPSMNVARSLRFVSLIGLALVVQIAVADDLTSFRNANWDSSDISRHGSLQIAALQHQIEALEQAEHPYTPALMPLLLDLGDAALQSERYELAEGAFRRHQHLVHRDDGVRSLDQSASISGLIKLYRATGDIRAYGAEVKFLAQLFEFAGDHSSPSRSLADLDLAVWETRFGSLSEAKDRYRQVIGRNKSEIDSASLQIASIGALGLGFIAYLEDRNPLVSMTAALEEVGQIARGVEQLDIAELERDLALFAGSRTSTSQVMGAGASSEPAWLGADSRKATELVLYPVKSRVSFRDDIELLYPRPPQGSTQGLAGYPLPMCRAALPDLVTGARHRHKSWKFDVEVQVATDGSAEAVNILDSNGPIAVKRWVKALAKEAQYRPALNDLGEPVPRTYRFTQAFDGTNQTQPPLASSWNRAKLSRTCSMLRG